MGAVVLSIDAELGWGFHDLTSPPPERINTGRRGWETTLDLLAEYEIPATWGIVGHLMLDGCDGEHADHPSPPGWFSSDPGRIESDSLWFAPDLVNAILEAAEDHEIASHSFSHLVFGAPETTPDMIDAELGRHRELAARWDLALESFIFPRNRIGHRGLLARHGFRAYRGAKPPLPFDDSVIQPVVKTLSLTSGHPPVPLIDPTVDEYGLLDLPPSMDLFGFEGLPRRVLSPVLGDPVVRAARRAIDAVAERELVFHGWFHPNNLVGPTEVNRLRTILEHIDRTRRDTELRVATVRDITREMHDV